MLPLKVDHITVVVMENHSFDDIIDNPHAAYINELARENVLFTNSFAVTHPSQPNYLALYSGSTQGVRSDACPLTFSAPSLGGLLRHAHLSLKGYMEDLPAPGFRACAAGEYVRKHDPLIDFDDTSPTSVVPYSELTEDLQANAYPSVAFIVPNLEHDMHDGSVEMGDKWLASNLPQIIAYNARHNGLLILTWDEDDRGSNNHIITIAIGPMLKAGTDDQRINHASIARAITDVFHLPQLTDAAAVAAFMR